MYCERDRSSSPCEMACSPNRLIRSKLSLEYRKRAAASAALARASSISLGIVTVSSLHRLLGKFHLKIGSAPFNLQACRCEVEPFAGQGIPGRSCCRFVEPDRLRLNVDRDNSAIDGGPDNRFANRFNGADKDV